MSEVAGWWCGPAPAPAAAPVPQPLCLAELGGETPAGPATEPESAKG